MKNNYKNIPENISGVDEIEILVIDDGCTDNTIKIAKNCGVNHFVIHERNLGLASAFRNGVSYYVAENGADIIVNTDGDNQYDGECIKDLVIPIINKKYDIVIGARPIDKIDSFSTKKKIITKTR